MFYPPTVRSKETELNVISKQQQLQQPEVLLLLMCSLPHLLLFCYVQKLYYIFSLSWNGKIRFSADKEDDSLYVGLLVESDL